MKLLHGILAPVGEGTILEVHLDVQDTTSSFNNWLEGVGFENDPFVIFHPPQYNHHLTGRMRVSPKNLSTVLPKIDTLVTSVISKAQSRGINLYAEVELARETMYFPKLDSSLVNGVLDGLTFRLSGQCGGAKADVHVEFKSGTVSHEVRGYLSRKHFYWVSTPPTVHFPAEEIATLQTLTWQGAKKVYDILCNHPLPDCTGIHLEQKLSMKTTRADLPMPEVIEVSCASKLST